MRPTTDMKDGLWGFPFRHLASISHMIDLILIREALGNNGNKSFFIASLKICYVRNSNSVTFSLEDVYKPLYEILKYATFKINSQSQFEDNHNLKYEISLSLKLLSRLDLQDVVVSMVS